MSTNPHHVLSRHLNTNPNMSQSMQNAILHAHATYKPGAGIGGTSGGSWGSNNTSNDSSSDEPKENTLGGAGEWFEQNQPQTTYYQPMNDQQFTDQAGQFRQIFEQPQIEALNRKLEEAIMNASVQEQSIRANFAGYEDALRRREREQGRLDLESAVARGAGRSGVVNHMDQRRQEHHGEMWSAEHARKMSELNAVAEQLGLTQRQVPIELQQLAEQASRLEAQEMQRLRDLDYSRGREFDMDQFQRMLNMFDRTQLTPFEQLQLYLEMAEVFGKSAAQLPAVDGSFDPAAVASASDPWRR